MTKKKENRWFRFLRNYRKHAPLIEALLTAVAILLAWFLWKETQRQVCVSRNANKIAKDTSDSSYALYSRNAIIESRAYILIKADDLIHFMDSNSTETTFLVKNFGKTPAYNVCVFPRVIKGNNVSHEMVDKNILNSFILEPDDQKPIAVPKCETILDNGKRISIEKGKIKLFFICKISYVDIFKIKRWSYIGLQLNSITRRPEAVPGFFEAN